jgi:hypothetical protein
MSNQAPTKATPLNNAVADVASVVSSGVPPTNAQVTKVLDEASTLIESKKKEAPLNETGKKIAGQVDEVIQSAKQMVLEKNPDEALQKFVVASNAAATEVKQSEAVTRIKDTTEEAADRATFIAAKHGIAGTYDLAKTANAFLKLSGELVTSREFRQLLVEFLDLLQEGLQTATQNIQQGLESTKEGLETVKQEVQSTEPAKEQAKRLADTAGQKIGEGISTGAKKAIDVADSASQTWQDIKEGKKSVSDFVPMSAEKKEQFRARFNALLDKISSNPDYNAAVQHVFTAVDQLKSLWFETVDKAQTSVEIGKTELKQSSAVQQMWDEGSKFLSRFVHPDTIEPLQKDLSELARTIQNDSKLRTWWADLKSYVTYSLQHPREVVSDERTAQLNSLVDRAFEYSMEYKYAHLTRRTLRQSRALVDQVRDDAMNNQLVSSTRQLMSTLFLDPKGNFAYKPDELRQLKILLTSLLMEEMKYIPVPRIQGSTDTYDFQLQNVMFYGYDLIPDHVLIKFESQLDVNMEKVQADVMRSNLSIRITHVKTHMKNIMFWVRRKGLINFEDHGLADVDLAGDGANLSIELEINANNKRGLTTKRIDVDLDRLKIHIIDSRHSWLLTIFGPFLENSIKRSIEREVENRIRGVLDRVFVSLSDIGSSVPVEKIGNVVKQNLLDLQATKNSLEVDTKTRTGTIGY